MGVGIAVHRKNQIGFAGIKGQANSAQIASWQATLHFDPARTTVGTFENTRIGAGNNGFPTVADAVPGAGVQSFGIPGIDDQVDDASLFTDKQRLPPGFSSVVAGIQSLLAVALKRQAHGAHVNALRIAGIDDDFGNDPGGFEANFSPALPSVDGAVQPVAQKWISGDVGVSSAHVHYFRIVGVDGNGPDGQIGSIIKDRRPGIASVGGFK